MRSSFVAARAAAAAAVVFALLVSCGPTDRTSSTAPRPRPVAPSAGVSTQGADPVIVAAGDIACGSNTPAGTACQHAQTAALIGTIAPDAVLLLGDNQYEDGTLADYNTFYGPTWGQYKSITYPAPGNHEYNTPNGTGYYDYFNGVGVQTGRAGTRGKGYYSYDLGAWHLIALNSNCSAIGGCGVGSPQEVWLKADLAAHANACVLAYWHYPRFSSGPHGNDTSVQSLWQALYAAKADVILTGHDHNYERFAPQTATGTLDNANGIREWVVGTGGKDHYSFGVIVANSVVHDNTSFGVLKLTLHPTSYDWQFVPVNGGGFTDAGTANCVGVAANQPPTASITAPANNATFAPGANVTFTGSATDPEDGALGGASLVWTSNRDGQIGTGTTVSTSTLSTGTHTITLTTTDSKGATGTATRTVTIAVPGSNQPPVASFSVVWCNVYAGKYNCRLDGTASTDDAGITAYQWTVPNATSTTPTAAAGVWTWTAPGVYTVTLTVRDAGGLTGTTSRQVTVGTPPPNQPPAVQISAPANNASVAQGTSVTFTGTGSDPEDGTLGGASLAWTSSLDGTLGTGTSVTTSTLSIGTHTITLTATDSKGATGTATQTLTVTPPPSGNQPPVADFFVKWCNVTSATAHNCRLDASTSTDDVGVTGWTWAPQGTTTSLSAVSGVITWSKAGTYNVTLTVRDAAGLTSTVTKAVAVP